VSESKFESNRPINLVEEKSRAVTWILLAAFSQTCRKNWEQEAERKDMKMWRAGYEKPMRT
jgi:hypothetical protein